MARLDFERLPLAEAAVRAVFHQILNLSVPLITKIAPRFQSEFPQLTETEELELSGGVKGPFRVPLRPGIEFGGHRQGLAIVLQQNYVGVKWRRSLMETEYPRFEIMRNALWKVVDALKTEMGDALSPVVVVNISYVNIIEQANLSAVPRDYFAEKVQLGIMREASKVHEVVGSWREEGGVDLRFDLRLVSQKDNEEEQEALRLATGAGIRLHERLNAKEALELVHDRLQAMFAEVISERAKVEWGLEVRDGH